jgi:hypothetical protein
MAFNLFEAPEYYQGLLGEEETKKLQGRAMTTGLVNAAIGYLAQPKTMGYGSALPYIGRALAGGLQSGQETIRSGLQDYEAQQKLAEMKRKQEQQQTLQGMISGIQDPNEKLFAQLAPEQYVASKVKSAESPFAKIDRKDYTTESFNKYLQSKNLGDLEPIAKESTQPSAVQEYNFARGQGYKGSFEDWKKSQKSEGVTVNYGAPVAGVDAQGNPVFFQPSKAGGSPQIVPGVAPLREEKPATESQAKAEAFGSQMKSASKEFDQIQKEGFAPGATASQAQVEIAGTPLRVFADPLAQRAQQSQAQWSEAYLRYKTGAAATEGEVKRNISTFFPKIGETDPKVIEQKARMRKQAEEDVMKSAKQPSSIKSPQQQAQPRSRADILKQYGL